MSRRTYDRKNDAKRQSLPLAESEYNLEKKRCEISVILCQPDEDTRAQPAISGRMSSVTDVLSFPQFDDLEEEIPEVCEICLGDVVICEQKAREQAEEFGHSFERELVYLFAHSVLHLLGYDHMEDDEKIGNAGTRRGNNEADRINASGGIIMMYRDLYAKAKEMLPRAYAPFSKFRVGAALLTKEGEVCTGVQCRELFVRRDHMRGTDRRLSKQFPRGYVNLKQSPSSASEGSAWPCGICRSVHEGILR